MKNINLLLILSNLMLLSDCSQSGRRKSSADIPNHSNIPIINSNEKVVIKMSKKNGVFQVPIELNGIEMFFIFDTGASTISISQTEAMFLLKQGSLTEEDILETVNLMDAVGNISEGTIVNLKTVKIGNKTLTNIKASVIPNSKAPLLLGQTFLENFGKISIDNHRGEIILE